MTHICLPPTRSHTFFPISWLASSVTRPWPYRWAVSTCECVILNCKGIYIHVSRHRSIGGLNFACARAIPGRTCICIPIWCIHACALLWNALALSVYKLTICHHVQGKRVWTAIHLRSRECICTKKQINLPDVLRGHVHHLLTTAYHVLHTRVVASWHAP